MSPPLFDFQGDLCYITDTVNGPRINTLRNQYRNETELLVLLNLIMTLEKIGLI